MSAEVAGQPVTVQVSTGYPWQGRVRVEVTRTGSAPWALRLRVPGWCGRPAVTVNGDHVPAQPAEGWLGIPRQWHPGDVAVLDLPMPARLTEGDPRADAVRGCLAVERGPLVYCLEETDLPPGARLDEVAISPQTPWQDQERPDLLGGVVALSAPGYLREPGEPAGTGAWWPYRPAGADGRGRWRDHALTAVPYFTWANREPGGMRVWLPGRPG